MKTHVSTTSLFNYMPKSLSPKNLSMAHSRHRQLKLISVEILLCCATASASRPIYAKQLNISADLVTEIKSTWGWNNTDGLVRMIATNKNEDNRCGLGAASVGHYSVSLYVYVKDRRWACMCVVGWSPSWSSLNAAHRPTLCYAIYQTLDNPGSNMTSSPDRKFTEMCSHSFHRRHASFVAFHSLLASCMKLLLIQYRYRHWESDIKETSLMCHIMLLSIPSSNIVLIALKKFSLAHSLDENLSLMSEVWWCTQKNYRTDVQHAAVFASEARHNNIYVFYYGIWLSRLFWPRPILTRRQALSATDRTSFLCEESVLLQPLSSLLPWMRAVSHSVIF